MFHFCGILRTSEVQGSPHAATWSKTVAATMVSLRDAENLDLSSAEQDGFFLAASFAQGEHGGTPFHGTEGSLAGVAGNPVWCEGLAGALPEAAGSTALSRALLDGHPQALANARGNFAAFAWNKRTRTLVLATDKLGLRPVYYRQHDGFLAFATSLRILLQSVGTPTSVDEAGLAQFLYFYQCLDGHTVFSGVRVLRPGEALVCTRDAKPSLTRYFDLASTRRMPISREEAEQRVFSCFQEAVHRRSTEETVEAFLSGGMDSRAVVAGLVDLGRKVHTFSASYPSSTDDVVSRQVATLLGTEHTCWHQEPADRVVFDMAPFSRYVKAHFPGMGKPGKRLLWTGDGGSVSLGHVYMTEASVQLASRPITPDNAADLFPQLRHHPTRHLSRAKARELAAIALDSIVREFGELADAEPDRRLFLYYMRNDQARHLHHHFEAISQTQVEFAAPFFDSDFVALVTALPISWFLRHDLYNNFIQKFRSPAGACYWQTYPGHIPGPHPAPAGITNQWETDWYRTPAVRKAYAAMALRLLFARRGLSAAYFSPAITTICALANVFGITRYNYEIDAARSIFNAMELPPGIAE